MAGVIVQLEQLNQVLVDGLRILQLYDECHSLPLGAVVHADVFHPGAEYHFGVVQYFVGVGLGQSVAYQLFIDNKSEQFNQEVGKLSSVQVLSGVGQLVLLLQLNAYLLPQLTLH